MLNSGYTYNIDTSGRKGTCIWRVFHGDNIIETIFYLWTMGEHFENEWIITYLARILPFCPHLHVVHLIRYTHGVQGKVYN